MTPALFRQTHSKPVTRAANPQGHDPHGPPEWTSVQQGKSFFASAPGWAEGFETLGYGLGGDGPRQVFPSPGRRPPQTLEHEQGVVLIRRFTHGGLLRGLTGERFSDPSRLLHEVRLTLALADLGLLVAEPVCLRAVCLGFKSWQLELGTRVVQQSQDLRAFLAERAKGVLGDRSWQNLLISTGRALREAHQLGLDHVDLQPANLLAQAEELQAARPARIWLIDLDRCVISAEGTKKTSRRNLSRLLRWIEGRYPTGSPLKPFDMVRFMLAYEPNRARRRRLIQEVLLAVRRGGLLHRAGRWIEGRLGLTREG